MTGTADPVSGPYAGADSDPGRLVCVLRALTEETWPSGQLTARTRSGVGWAYRWLVPERCGSDRLVQLESCRPRLAHKRRETDMVFPTTVHQLAHIRRCALTNCVDCVLKNSVIPARSERVLWRHPHFKLKQGACHDYRSRDDTHSEWLWLD